MIGALLSTDFAEARDRDALLERGLPGPFPFEDRPFADRVASIESDPAPSHAERLPATRADFQGRS